MKYKKLGSTGFEVSAVSYGGIVSAARYDRTVFQGDGQAASDRYAAWAVERGVNYFDVAPAYGDAQEMLGNSLRPHRKKVFLACKTACRTREEARKEMLSSLALLHTDYFDVYQMHAISSMEDVQKAFAPGGVMELLLEMKEKGIARKIGFTAHCEEAALSALDLYDFDTVLFPLNWHMHMAHGMGGALCRRAEEKGFGLLCMKSMIERAWAEEERFASKYPKSWCRPIDPEEDAELLTAALKYALSLHPDTVIPPGNFDHFRFAVEHIDRAVSEPLTEREEGLLRDRLETVRDRPFFGPDSYTLSPARTAGAG